MSKIAMMKTPGGALVPVDQEGADLLHKLKVGEGVTVELKRARNLKHHRKFMALLNLAYDAWEPTASYKGEPVQKNFERFRADILILCGHSEAVVNIKGEVRFVAKSMSFANMDQVEFDALYQAAITVLLHRVLTTYTRDDLEAVVEKLLAFS